MPDIDRLDKQLINLLQREFPLIQKPYAALGQYLNINESEAISRIKRLKATGIIRLISPVINAHILGYQTTLVAMYVSKDRLDNAEKIIASHPGVSHGYEREHHINIWFTMAVPPEANLKLELQRLTSSVEADDVFSLPATRVFKINTYFNTDNEKYPSVKASPASRSMPAEKAEVSSVDRMILKELQQDLLLVPAPFAAMSEQMGMKSEAFLTHCRSLLQRGIIRRFGASINHQKLGYEANAMTCWAVPLDKIDIAGQEISHIQNVSHCYERKTNPRWHYNLFAMIHGRTREECQKLVSEISQTIAISDYVMLFSTKEFKKTRIIYQV